MSVDQNDPGFRLSAQQRSEVLAERHSGRMRYSSGHVQLAVPVEIKQLERALALLSARHEILRTLYREVEGLRDPLQIVSPTAAYRAVLGTSTEPPCAQALLDAERGPVMAAVLADSRLVLALPSRSCDAASLRQLLVELRELCQGRQVHHADEPLQYVDYAEWQAELFENELGREGTTFWREALAQAVRGVRPLPFARVAAPHHLGSTAAVETVKVDSDAVRQLAEAHALPVDELAFFLWSAFVARLLEREQVSLLTTYDARSDALAHALGRFELRFPVQCPVRAGLPLLAAFDVARAAWQRHLVWRDTYDETQLFQAGLPWLSDAVGFHFQHLSLDLDVCVAPEAQLEPLRLACTQRDVTLELVLHYDTARFDRETIALWAEQLASFCRGCAQDPSRELAAVSVVGAHEQRRILGELAGAPAPVEQELLHEVFQRQARAQPAALALRAGKLTLSYGELDRRANQVANYLQAIGCCADEPIGVIAERSVKTVVAILGVLKAGGAYLPLDPDYPPARLRMMLEDSGATKWLRASTALEVAGIKAVSLAADSPVWSCSERAPRCCATPQNLAYLIYTSGSTGQPKGVMVTHSNAVSSTRARAQFYGDPVTGFLLVSSFSFDSSVAGLFWTLSQGGVLCLPNDPRDPEALAQLIVRHGLSHTLMLPSLYEQLLAAFDERPALGCAIVAGEACPRELVASHMARLPDAVLVNEYGPTEGSVWCTAARLAPGPCAAVTIGRPIETMQAYVLDAALDLSGIGVAGELYIAGAGLSRGYQRRPALTAARYVPHPFGPPGARLYRTGDRVRLRPDGDLEYLGRSDDQIKLRGHRVELGEIEACLREHAELTHAVALVHEDVRGDGRLCVYVVPRERQRNGAELRERVRAQLASRLPEYMLPNHIVLVERLPLAPNGKLDRAALPRPEDVVEDRPHVEPATESERRLAALWRELLGVARVGLDDDFFALGGHSLLAAKLTARMREAFGVRVPVRRVFEQSRLHEMASCLDELHTDDSDDLPVLEAVARSDRALPLSPAQNRLWFLWQLDPHSAAYNVPIALRLRGQLVYEALQNGLDGLVRRHEVLRTTFVQLQDGTSSQHIHAPAPVGVRREDLTALSEDEREQHARRSVLEEARQPFDLTVEPPLRVRLLQLADQEHVLAFTLHHIASDAWSAQLLVAEFAELYASALEHRGPRLRELPLQYADFALWQLRWLASAQAERQLSYWRARLADAPTRLEWIGDRTRPEVQNFQGAAHRFELSTQLTGALKRLAADSGASLAMLLLASFKALLRRRTGATDVLVGMISANREHAQLEPLIGFFVNTLVVRSRVGAELPFRTLLQEVRAAVLEAQEHQALPFERVVDALRPERSLAHNPMFQVAFDHQRSEDARRPELPGLVCEALESDRQATQFELALHTVDAGASIRVSFSYMVELFDHDTVVELAAQWRTLLAAVVAEPATTLGSLPLLSEAAREHVLRVSRGSQQAWPDGTVLPTIQRMVVAAPDAIAVAAGAAQLSYGELNARANRLAGWLRLQGVGPEVFVGVCMDRGLELLIALLAIWKAGGVYVPLDPEYPQARLEFIVRDSGAQLVLTQATLVERLTADAVHVHCLQELGSELAKFSSHDVDTSVTPEHAAYSIYTSGSTGTPKGVVVTHRGLHNCLAWMTSAFALGSHDRVLHKASIGFDFSLPELVWPLCVGAQIVMAPSDAQRDPHALGDLIEHACVTQVNFVPSMLRAFMDAGVLQGCRTLRHVMSGGEALSADLQRAFAAQHRAELHNGYGPTETTIFATHWLCGSQRETDTVPIGRPYPNVQAYILDARLEPVPRGTVGELYIGGAGLARGYHRRPSLTASRFIPDQFSVQPGGRLFRSGDLARQRADGEIEYLGRIDDQVKVRGNRIELGEIEARLRKHVAVREAVVLVRETAAGKQLVAYAVMDGASDAGLIPSLRQHLREVLPEYMVPSHWLFVSVIPVTPNGKLDRSALLALQPESTPRVHAPPRSPEERTLFAIWSEVLSLEQLGIHDNFFELGGDSILSLQVVSRARSAGLALTPKDMFRRQTIAELARAAAVAPARAQASAELPWDRERLLASVPHTDAAIEDVYPLSSTQQGMLFHSLSNPGSGVYLAQLSVRVRGLDLERFAAAWQFVLARHAILRTGFVLPADGAAPVQVVYRDVPSPLRLLDARECRADDVQLEALARQEREAGMDLSRPPLLRVLVVQLTPDRQQLIWTHHHALLDGWSSARLIDEVLSHYLGESLAPLVGSYRDYIAWLERQDSAANEQFWKRQLSQLEGPTLLCRSMPQRLAGTGFGRVLSSLSNEQAERLSQFVRRERVTLNTLVQAAWLLLLQCWTGQDTVTFGATASGRPAELPGTEAMVGLFIRVLPVIQRPKPYERVAAFLRALQDDNASLREHEASSLSDVQRWAGAPTRPLFDTIISFQNLQVDNVLRQRSAQHLEFGRLSLSAPTNYPLSLTVTTTNASLDVRYDYSRQHLDEGTVQALADQLSRLLLELVRSPDRRLADIELLAAAEHTRLTRTWSRGVSVPLVGLDVLDAIAQHARARAHDVAVSWGTSRVHYGELDRRATVLAAALQSCGVETQAPVAMFVPRGIPWVELLLGVWRAGGIYVPVDPTHPPSHVTGVIRRCGVRWVLTTKALRSQLQRALAELPEEERPAVFTAEELAQRPQQAPLRKVNLPPHQLAYVMYTSGSTGVPKGVMIEQGGLQNHLHNVISSLRLTTADVVAQTAPHTFDISIWQVCAAWVVGARVDIVPDATVRDPAALLSHLRESGITVLELVPSLQRVLLEAGSCALPALRALRSAGEALPRELAVRWLERYPELRIDNAYAPTECSDGVALQPLTLGAFPEGDIVPLGRPIENTELYILDGALRPTPTGAIGELYVAGRGLARGYWRAPATTAQAFVPHPFAQDAGERLYRTGDLARFREDGVVEYIGRADHQVKVHGHRIELGAIEACLRAHAAVQNAAVVTRRTPAGVQLIAYAVTAESSESVLAALRQHMRELLPEYALPSHVVLMRALPLTSNGKLARAALPEPEVTATDHVEPSNLLERAIAAIWKNALQLERVSVNDDFFVLGGDSLLAMRVTQQLNSALARSVPLSILLEARTISRLAELLSSPEDLARMKTLVALAASSHQRPALFCLHYGEGEVSAYRDLANELGCHRPVYGIQSQLFEHTDVLDTSIAAMAERYAEIIRRTAGHEPIHLLGWSFGGRLALEVARQLAQSGRELGFIGVVDDTWLIVDPTADTNLEVAPVLDAVGRERAQAEFDQWLASAHFSAHWRMLQRTCAADSWARLLQVFADMRVGERPRELAPEYDLLRRAQHMLLATQHTWRPWAIPAHVYWATQSLRTLALSTTHTPRLHAGIVATTHLLDATHHSIITDPWLHRHVVSAIGLSERSTASSANDAVV